MPALSFSLSLAAGIITGYYIAAQRFIWLMLAVAAVACLSSVFMKGRGLRRALLNVACLLIGTAIMTIQKQRLSVQLPDRQVQMKAVAIEPAREYSTSWMTDFIAIDGCLAGRKLRCYIKKEAATVPQIGGTYTLRGRARQFSSDVSDGNFNYQRWADSHSLTAQMTVYEGNIMREGDLMEQLPFMERVMLKSKILRAELLKHLSDEGLDGISHSVVAAMAFGDRSTLTKETRDMYSRTGAAHLLALSGMHLGVLFMLLTLVFGRMRNKLLRCVLMVVTVWTYVIFVGMPSSVVRAATMLTIYSLVSVSGRDHMSANALFVTFALMLLCNPMMIWDVGFQLSFLAVLSIFVYFSPIYNMVSSEFLFEHPLVRFVWSTVAMSLAAQIGTSPLSAYYFGRFPTIFLLTNLVAIPLVTMLLYSAFLLVLFSAVPVVGSLMMFSVKFFSALLSASIGVFASWKWGSIENISINWMQLMLMYAVIAVLTWMSARLIRR